MFTKKQIELQKIEDKKSIMNLWNKLEYDLASKSTTEDAKQIRLAFEDCYKDMFGTGDLIEWAANLYDPVIGGFYYSNSARDNDGFLPDIESTKQAMEWLLYFSTKDELGNEIKSFYPEWMKKQVIKFLKERQDENGYFYHPQWDKAFTDTKHNRRGRDLDWACSLLLQMDEAPTYDTPNGVRGNGLLWDGTPVSNYIRSEKKDDPTPVKEAFVTPHLKDKQSFIEYLGKFDLNGASYSTGNTLESQATQIFMRDAQLKEAGIDYSLCETLKEWFDKHQNKQNGLWTLGENITRSGINGLLKISGTYNRVKQPIPNPELGIASAIKIIEEDSNVATVCDVLNPWYALSVLTSNIKNYHNADESESGKKAKDAMQYIFAHSPEMISATKNLIMQFKKPDGSFSYCKTHSSMYSQKHIVAVADTNEGDVNATIIGSAAVVGHIFHLLGADRIPAFTTADKMRLLNILEKRNEETKRQ